MFRYGPRPLGRGAESRGSSHVPGTRAFVLTDALGSIRAISDSTGTVVGTYKYSPYGTVAIHTGASISLQYAGGYTDAESGLTYYINRYYSPGNGTFTTVDPALDMTEQPYAYAANDPVNYADFEFVILGRAKPGTELDRMEEYYIRRGGGRPTGAIRTADSRT